MSLLSLPTECLYFTSVIWNSDLIDIDQFKDIWTERFGSYTEMLPQYNPSFPYYAKEMGDEHKLGRTILACTNPETREVFVSHKLWATQYENKHLVNNKRVINVDIGMLSLENMVLATGKPFSHRVYLSQGVYADLNYIYRKNRYETLPWTYPDYAHEEKINFFQNLRKLF